MATKRARSSVDSSKNQVSVVLAVCDPVQKRRKMHELKICKCEQQLQQISELSTVLENVLQTCSEYQQQRDKAVSDAQQWQKRYHKTRIELKQEQQKHNDAVTQAQQELRTVSDGHDRTCRESQIEHDKLLKEIEGFKLDLFESHRRIHGLEHEVTR